MKPKINELISKLNDTLTLANGPDAIGVCCNRQEIKGTNSTCCSRMYDNRKRWKLSFEKLDASMCDGCWISYLIGMAYGKTIEVAKKQAWIDARG